MSTFTCPRCGHVIEWTEFHDLRVAHTQHLLKEHREEIEVQYKEIQNLID